VAVEALGSFGSEKAIPTLAAALSDPDETVRWYAASALEKLGEPAVPALVAALDNEAAAATAIASLGRVGDSATLKALLDRLDAAKGETKAAIIWSVGELLRRHPASPHADAARHALTAASQLTDAPEVARRARYALRKTAREPE
jgi:HEAT repeat protein